VRRARGRRKLIHVSSDMAFDGASGPFAEDARPSPITPYGRAKARAEFRARGCRAAIVRCSLLLPFAAA
jgi:dTDP-4-dehydrorhamnose reductase